MKQILFAIALATLAVTDADAGRVVPVGHFAHGGHVAHTGHFHGGRARFFLFAPPLFFGLGVLAAAPYYYYPPPYYYYPPPAYYPPPGTTYYVPGSPNYAVTEQPSGGAVPQAPGNGVTELGPVGALQQNPDSGQVSVGRLFIYPGKGQSQEQQTKDWSECNGWAAGQTGYDPNQPQKGGANGQGQAALMNFGRAVSACLEGRGYTVR